MKGLNIRYVLILIFSLFLAVGSIYAETKMIPLYIGEETFTVEIADNPVTQARGL
ncbi:MAG: hypothetical protein GY757_09425, partial [bacterium]|nr:hypothetical protein [bacterium]